MIVNEHVRDYINSLAQDNSDELRKLEKWAHEHHVPIIRRETQNLIKYLLRTRKPHRILEIGTAIGFSAIFMSDNTDEDCSITTIEKVEMRLTEARKNLFGRDKIILLEGDAVRLLSDLKGKYDFIFLDAAKGQYMNMLPDIIRLLIPGGMLVTDNVLQEGTLAESKYAVRRRDRTIHMRMREYLYTITHMNELETICIAVGDGMSLSIRNEQTEGSIQNISEK